jgi:hypothetical protein
MTAFTLGSMIAGAALTGTLGLLGHAVFGATEAPLWAVAIIAITAGLLDLSPLKPWTPTRQVNENWIRSYRGWVYGAGFGIQLGMGFTVFVMSWGYWAMLAIAFLSGSFYFGALLGAAFGLGRGLLLLMARASNTPERLAIFHQRMASSRSRVFGATGAVTVIIALIALV